MSAAPFSNASADRTSRFTDLSTRSELDGDSMASSVKMQQVQRYFGAPRVKAFKVKKTLLRYERPMSFAGNDVLLKVRFPGKRKSLLSMELRF